MNPVTQRWPTAQRQRNPLVYFIIGLALFGLGLASRHFANPLTVLFGKYPGDTMWAMLLYCCLDLLLPRASIARIALFTAAISLTVELLKFYHAPWMIALRASTFGYLVLGHIFSIENLMAYAIGIVLFGACEWAWLPLRSA